MMNNPFKSWPLFHKIWIGIAIAAFFLSGLTVSIRNGNKEHHAVDATTEQLILHASDVYVNEGFMKYNLLPLSPPFGFDNEGKQRTEPFVYTHYFPGPYWVAGVMKKIFGSNGISLTRVIPLTINVFALAFLASEFAVYVGSTFLACLLATLILTARSVTVFSISFAGHGYVMGFLLLLTALLFRFSNNSKSGKHDNVWMLFFTGLIFGFLQIWFSIDFLPLTFLWAIGFSLSLSMVPLKNSKKLILGIFVGGCLGMLLQIGLYSAYLGSFAAVIDEFMKWGTWRMGLNDFGGAASGEDVRLSTVLREYNKQAYGATGFTAYNIIILCLFFMTMSFKGGVSTIKQFKNLFLGLLFAYLAAVSWNVLMRQHSMIHVQFIPRHYFVLLLYFLITALPISKELVRRSARTSARY